MLPIRLKSYMLSDCCAGSIEQTTQAAMLAEDLPWKVLGAAWPNLWNRWRAMEAQGQVPLRVSQEVWRLLRRAGYAFSDAASPASTDTVHVQHRNGPGSAHDVASASMGSCSSNHIPMLVQAGKNCNDSSLLYFLRSQVLCSIALIRQPERASRTQCGTPRSKSVLARLLLRRLAL